MRAMPWTYRPHLLLLILLWLQSVKLLTPEEHEEGGEKYRWTNITVYFEHKTEYRYDDNIWSNNSRVIYHRRVCYQSAAVPISDGYVGSETISAEFRFKKLIEEENLFR